MAEENWYITIEGMGESHDLGSQTQANKFALDCVKGLEDAGHRVFQARYGSNRGEENLMDPPTRAMHEALCKPTRPQDLHEELVQMGVEADALRKPSAAGVGAHTSGDEGAGWKSESQGVGQGDELQQPPRTKGERKEEVPKTTHGRRA